MIFFQKPKIQRVAEYLHAELREMHQDRWAFYLTVCDKYALDSRQIANETNHSPTAGNTLTWLRAKEDFSWKINLGDNGIPAFILQNAEGQFRYYHKLDRYSRKILLELNRPSPNYEKVVDWAIKIKNYSLQITCVESGQRFPLKMNYFTGDNFLIDFVSGLAGIVYAPVMLTVGFLFAIPYFLSQSNYCGSPEFILDCAAYFCSSLTKTIGSVLFPVSMLYSKYHTDSFNITQGKISRAVDNLIFLAGQSASEPDESVSLLTAID